jgi:hypothetical protein
MLAKTLKLLPLLPFLTACAQQPASPPAAPAYVSEAPLPQGWPQPGPYNQVSEKSYPGYRAAFTTGKGESGSFWTLFLHIKKNDIPMTAPVEMAMQTGEGELSRTNMAFLYQNEKVGQTGAAGSSVEVRDVPANKVLNYTWQGSDSKANLATARAALETELTQRKLTATQFRLLGYNGPGTPRSKATWELQAILPPNGVSPR